MLAAYPLLRFWKYGVMAALALALALTFASRNHWRDKARVEKAAHAAFVANVKQATKEAERLAIAAKDAAEAAARDTKEKADANRSANQVAGDALAADYRARNRCLRPEASPGPAGRADLPRPAAAAGKPAEAAPDAELVGVSADDFTICTANSLDLLNAAQAAADWRAKGLAE